MLIDSKGASDDGTKEVWATGEYAYFEYHCLRAHDSDDAEAWYRDHQRVEVVDMPDSDGRDWLYDGATMAERTEAATPLLYKARFADGHEHDVFEDELLVSPSYFTPGLGPPPASDIAAARQSKARQPA